MNPWNYAPNDLRRMIDIEFVTGVNRPVIHTSVHQPVDDKVPRRLAVHLRPVFQPARKLGGNGAALGRLHGAQFG
jgi:hypothetical protein